MKKSKAEKAEWDLSSLLTGDNDPEAAKKRKRVEEENRKFANKWKNRADYLENPAILKEALDEYEKLNRFYGTSGDEGLYFYLRTQQDSASPKLKAKFNDIQDFEIKLKNEINFFEHGVAMIASENQEKFLSYGGLAPYRHFLEKLFAQARYLLSDEEEKILNLKQPTSHVNWVKMTSGFLAKEEREILTEKGKKERKPFGDIINLLDHKSKKTRDSAAAAFNDILAKNSDAAEAEMNSILANKKTNDELRKMARPDLARHIDDDVESGTVDALTEAVSEKFKISKKYYDLKAKLMGVKKLEYHERNVEYGKLDKRYSYEQAVGFVHEVFSQIDEKFSKILDDFVNNGRVDVYPKKGKRSGAFCMTGLPSQPVYVFLNFSGDLKDVETIAHEFGHAINSELQKEKQNSLNFGTPLSTAEVASTFMEDFVLEEITRNADDETRLAIMMAKLNGDISTIFRQVACYSFEKELHNEFRRKGYLSKEDIGQLFQKHMKAYMGPFVTQSPGTENWWIYWSHIRSFFYNYSYASGLLISKAMQNYYKKDSSFIGKVKDFLSAGCSDSPKNLFKNMGINISDKKFWEDGLAQVESLLKETQKLAKKLRKI
ncbi:MAG: M3 family oligoendopeptidase [Candidatus Pacebacteria bacterium]|nr:M3 family oligoendopeptidase [Candidatus Paceibacterota bacterium]